MAEAVPLLDSEMVDDDTPEIEVIVIAARATPENAKTNKGSIIFFI
jgi:hypothetical protein